MNQDTATLDHSTALDISALFGRAARLDLNTLATLRALLFIHDQGNPCISEIAAHTGKSTAALTGTIDTLEQRDFVRRVRPPHDRRAIRVEITFVGREAVRSILNA